MSRLRLIAGSVATVALGAFSATLLLTGCFGRSDLEDFGSGVPDGGILGDGATGSGAGGAVGAGGSVQSAGGSVFGSGGSVFGSGGSVFGSGGNVFGSGGNVFGSGGNVFGSGGNVFGSGGNVFGSGGSVFGSGGSTVGAGGRGSGGVIGAGGRGSGGIVGSGGALGGGGVAGTGGATGAGGFVGAGGATGAGGFTPLCSAATCSAGCCDAAGQCEDGRTDPACGSSGQRCTDCTASGLSCAAAGYCYQGPHCGPDNCAGCCTPTGVCRAGTGERNCGRYGAVCENCNSVVGETCQSGACGVPGATCPTPYGGCQPGSSTTPPTRSTACTTADLAAVAKACAGVPPGAACTPELGALARSNSACFGCLAQFLYPGGAAKCLAPFLTDGCNQSLTCALDCSNASCGQCGGADKKGCQDGAFASGGTCNPYVGGYLCAAAAFGGQGSFCDLQRIGDTGVFLQGVGAYYCSK